MQKRQLPRPVIIEPEALAVLDRALTFVDVVGGTKRDNERARAEIRKTVLSSERNVDVINNIVRRARAEKAPPDAKHPV